MVVEGEEKRFIYKIYILITILFILAVIFLIHKNIFLFL